MDKRHRLSAKNKTDLMPNNASCKSWDTPLRKGSLKAASALEGIETEVFETMHETIQRL
jgi:hypothetical protein